MAKEPHFNLGFIGLNQTDMDDQSNDILIGMNDNADYADVGSKLTDAQNAKTEWLRIKGSKGAMRNRKSLFAAATTTLIEKLVTMGEWARDKYPEDATKWQTTGYTIQFYDSEETGPGLVTEITAADGDNIGDIIIKYTAGANAEFYELKIWKKGDAIPEDAQKSVKGLKMKVTGKNPGTIYMISIRTVGSKDRFSQWTTAITFSPRVDLNA